MAYRVIISYKKFDVAKRAIFNGKWPFIQFFLVKIDLKSCVSSIYYKFIYSDYILNFYDIQEQELRHLLLFKLHWSRIGKNNFVRLKAQNYFFFKNFRFGILVKFDIIPGFGLFKYDQETFYIYFSSVFSLLPHCAIEKKLKKT